MLANSFARLEGILNQKKKQKIEYIKGMLAFQNFPS